MTKAILRWGLISLLVLLSPLVYSKIQGFVTLHAVFLVIKACSAKSKTALFLIFTTFNFLSASLTALVTVLPSGYLERKHTRLIAVLFTIAMLSIPAWVVSEEKTQGFVGDVWLGQLVVVIISVWFFVAVGARIPEMLRRKV
jgi:hypothetical protein